GKLGVLGLERLELAHPVVVGGVVDRGIVQDVVAVVGVPDEPPELAHPRGHVAGDGHGAGAPSRASRSSSTRSTMRSGASGSSAAREKKPQVTPTAATPAARAARRSKGASPT